ncbi:hypothetical protein ANO11243_061960 [Dothideomycetidae sp. 11243]|nr:hypothetical protein ANO11243_061960 [fungal sp. No.11243]
MCVEDKILKLDWSMRGASVPASFWSGSRPNQDPPRATFGSYLPHLFRLGLSSLLPSSKPCGSNQNTPAPSSASLPIMSPGFHGAACKTCRRRGRKCTRELPKCRSCTNKGIECEGYVFKWPGMASRGRLARGISSLSMPAPSETTSTTVPLTARSRGSNAPGIRERQQLDLPTAGHAPTQPDSMRSDQSNQDRPPEGLQELGRLEELVEEQSIEEALVDIVGQDTGLLYTETDLVMLGLQDNLLEDRIIEELSSDDTTNMLPDGILSQELGDWEVPCTINAVEMEEGDRPTSLLKVPSATSIMSMQSFDLIFGSVWDLYNIPGELTSILDYHLAEVSPRLCVDRTTARNPYSQYILPMAMEKPALLYACAALAACHFDVRTPSLQHGVDGLRFRGRAMRRLQEQMWTENTAKDESNLAAVLMLILTDMCAGGFSNFDAHFAAAKRLVDLRGTSRTDGAFVEQYVAWLDIMSAALTHRRPHFGREDLASWSGTQRQWSYDVVPCPPDQFHILAEIIDLHKSTEDLNDPMIASRVIEIKDRLLALPMHNERDNSWLHVTEAYRSAIALFAIRSFGLDADDDEISWLTQNVFYHIKMTPPSTGWADSLLWPLFQAGLDIKDTRRRRWIKERAKSMQGSGGFRNVETTIGILDGVWSQGESARSMDRLCSDGLGILIPV